MRGVITVLIMAGGVGLVGGCSGPLQVAGEAAPEGVVSRSPSVRASSAATVPTAPSPSPSSAPSASQRTPSVGEDGKSGSGLVLGPTGLGELRIGMTRKKAVATGGLGAVSDGDCGSANLKAAESGAYQVVFSEAEGLIYIPAFGDVATPEGIRLGSTPTRVQRAYPDFAARDDANGLDNRTGTGLAYSGFNDEFPDVHYRFGFKNGKLTELAIVGEGHGCGE